MVYLQESSSYIALSLFSLLLSRWPKGVPMPGDLPPNDLRVRGSLWREGEIDSTNRSQERNERKNNYWNGERENFKKKRWFLGERETFEEKILSFVSSTKCMFVTNNNFRLGENGLRGWERKWTLRGATLVYSRFKRERETERVGGREEWANGERNMCFKRERGEESRVGKGRYNLC